MIAKLLSNWTETSKKLTGTSLAALTIFVALNVLVEFFHINVHSDSRNVEMVEENRVQDLIFICETAKHYPDLMMLGSSVIGLPFADLTRSRDFRPFYFVNQFNALLGTTDFVSLNMGTDGAMISDSSLLVRKCLTDTKKPRFIVLGVAPRDFGDGSRPYDSYQFKTLAQLKDFANLHAMYLPEPDEKLYFIYEKCAPIFQYRGYAQHYFAQLSNEIWHGQSSQPVDELAQIKTQQSSADNWIDMINQYRSIYSKLRPDLIEKQAQFLARFIQDRQTAQTKLLIINMPLSEDNRQLLPPGFYEKFRKDLGVVVATNGAEFLDLGSDSEFERKDFLDCAHINRQGCRKLMTHIVKFMNIKKSTNQDHT
ncbi:MAG: hypothetical protein HYX67_14805 [Candidatus Melainabacteria bacterium]|nr:hypothetical protein [Candidatus Melainabacteria bacterium]